MEIANQRLFQKTHLPVRSVSKQREGQKSSLGHLLCWFYGFVRPRMRPMVLWLIKKIEGGELYSITLREVLRKYHGVDVGLYTMGAPLVPGAFRPGTKIGRFCSIFWTVRAFNANHPMNLKSTHALFFNPVLGLVDKDLLIRPPTVIGNDIWMGHNAIIMPSVREIGDGAVIGAGAVVHSNVPPYAVVTGNPGRVVRYRFSREVIAELLASHWWDKPLSEIILDLESFRSPLEGETIR